MFCFEISVDEKMSGKISENIIKNIIYLIKENKNEIILRKCVNLLSNLIDVDKDHIINMLFKNNFNEIEKQLSTYGINENQLTSIIKLINEKTT